MKSTCTVRDGRFVEPCDSLEALIDNPTPGFSRRKGIARWALVNLKSHKPTRTYVGVLTREHPNGFLFNFCPICGSDISAPFTPTNEPQQEGGAA